MTRVLVCGGRNYSEQTLLNATLDWIDKQHGITTLIEGGASGADALARTWAVLHNIPVLTFPAQWTKFGRSAGHKRNVQMLDEGQVELVVAFPGGVGTADMVRLAKAAQLEVFEVEKFHALD